MTVDASVLTFAVMAAVESNYDTFLEKEREMNLQ